MHITHIKIRNFRAVDNLDLDLRDEFGAPRSVIALAGPNGSGKTSVLYAVTNALRGIFGYRTEDVPEPNRDDIRVALQAGGGWSSAPTDVLVSVKIQFGAEEQQDIRAALALLERQSPPDLPDGSLTVNWRFPPLIGENGVRMPFFHTDIEPALPNVRSWLQVKSWVIQGWRQRVRGIAGLRRNIGGLFFFPQDRDLRRRVGVGAPTLDTESGTTGASSEQPPSDRPTVSDLLDDFSRRFSNVAEDDPDNWQSHVKRLYATICAPKKYEGFLFREDAPLGSPVFSDHGHTYPLSHAASGEHVILEYIVELCRFGPLNRSIILIDEPEVHLHPLWLRRLYLNLPAFGDGNQFILTTHSPELRRRAGADNALIELGSLEGDDRA